MGRGRKLSNTWTQFTSTHATSTHSDTTHPHVDCTKNFDKLNSLYRNVQFPFLLAPLARRLSCSVFRQRLFLIKNYVARKLKRNDPRWKHRFERRRWNNRNWVRAPLCCVCFIHNNRSVAASTSLFSFQFAIKINEKEGQEKNELWTNKILLDIFFLNSW